MGFDNTTRSKSQETHLNQQGSRKAIAGKLRHGLASLLTVLLVVGIWASPSAADLPTDCVECHGTFADVHGSVTHQATPGSGQVALFPDNGHDDAGWSGPKPYFAVTVECTNCHNTYLPAIHSNDCSTCHPSPYDTVTGCGEGSWGGGCQQGGCHSVIHDDVFQAHIPFENAYDPENDCTRCHEQVSWDVLPENCLNCHATPGGGYANPPVTTSDAKGYYGGAAQINFSIKESDGRVGIGRTFYKLDGAEVASGSKVVVSAPGSHELEFWSVDQYGISEASTNTEYFTVEDDSTPPTTTSNAQAIYYQGGIITLSATDESTLGVKNTYYRLNGGLTQTGTTINIPAPPGEFTYTLDFWSVDWSGNIETQHTVTFTVISGSGTIRLVWWGCDLEPSHAPYGSDQASWTIRRGGSGGTVVASGSGLASSGWDGIDDITLPVSPTPYYVFILWESDDGEGDGVEVPVNYISTAGQVIRISY